MTEPDVAPALRPFESLGRWATGIVESLGRFGSFLAQGVGALVTPPFKLWPLLGRIHYIGYRSLLIILLTGAFTGMVLGLQIFITLSRFGSEAFLGPAVALSLIRELGPVLAALMVAGRIGAAFAAEIGTMRVTDQIDALTTLSTDPMKYLVAPRILAATLALPLLVVVADILGIMGGWLIGTLKLGFVSAAYLKSTFDFLQTEDVLSGLAKAGVFGFVIGLMGTWCGYTSRGGAQGVGGATTLAVVASSILILALDYALTEAFFAQ
jgi:phospholipid/cholesterol/gamma-HCH transport system permease protein